MNGNGRGVDRPAAYWSLGGVLIALLALTLTRLVHLTAVPAPDASCVPPPLVVSLPEQLPAPSGTVVPSSPAGTPAAGTPSATPNPVAISIRQLFRADDPPADHGLAVTDGPLMPLVIPIACTVPESKRRPQGEPCVRLLPPGGSLCASGAVGVGRLSSEQDAPTFAVQAGRVVLRDADGATRLDTLQGYFRYDDPEHGLVLLCPDISLLEPVGPNARQFVVLCSNEGEEGWAVSGQITDGGTAASDSIGLTIDAPNGNQTALVGPLAAGSIIVRNGPDDAGR